MSLSTSKVLGDSLYRTFSRNGILVIVGVYLASLVGTIGFSSLVFDAFESLWNEIIAEEPDFADLFDGPEVFLPLAYDIPDAVALFLVAASILATVVLIAVAVRVFHAGYDRELPAEIVFDNIAWVGINLFIGGIVFGFLWLLGLIFFIIPGIIIFVLLIYFVAAIAIEDRNFVDGFARSIAVTKGHRLQVFVLFLAVFLIAIAASVAFAIVASFFFLLSPLFGELIDLVAQSVITVYVAAVIATSYRTLTQPAEELSTEDDPFEEFTPASESTEW